MSNSEKLNKLIATHLNQSKCSNNIFTGVTGSGKTTAIKVAISYIETKRVSGEDHV